MSKEATPEQASALEPDTVETSDDTLHVAPSHALETASVASGALAGAMAGAVAGPIAAMAGGLIGGAIGVAAGLMLDHDAHAQAAEEEEEENDDTGTHEDAALEHNVTEREHISPRRASSV